MAKSLIQLNKFALNEFLQKTKISSNCKCIMQIKSIKFQINSFI